MLRPKKRYMAVSDLHGFSIDEVEKAVRNMLVKIYGINGLAEAGFKKIHSGKMHVFVCNADWLPKVVLALSLVREIDGRRAIPKTLKVSGTLKALSK